MTTTNTLVALLVLAAVAAAAATIVRRSPSGPDVVTPRPDQLRPGPVKHDLSQLQISRITAVQRAFAEVDPTPIEKWLDDFSRDTNPDSEIAVYEAMAVAFTGFTAKRPLSADAKKEVYSIVLDRSWSSDSDVIQKAKTLVLTRDDVVEILRLYPAPPKPVTVAR